MSPGISVYDKLVERQSASQPEVPPGIVCLTCGVKGATHLLIYCQKCQDSAGHLYCLDEFPPNADETSWVCWDCAPKAEKLEAARKSERISTQQEKAVKHRLKLLERLNASSPSKCKQSIHNKSDRAQLEEETLKVVEMRNMPINNLMGKYDEIMEGRRSLNNGDGNKGNQECECAKDGVSISICNAEDGLKGKTCLMAEESRVLKLADGSQGKENLGHIGTNVYPRITEAQELCSSVVQRKEQRGDEIAQSIAVCSLPVSKANKLHPSDERMIKDVIKRVCFVLDDKSIEDAEGKFEAQVSLVSEGHCIPRNTLSGQTFIAADNDFQEPILDPIWRGFFRIANGCNQPHIGIWAHLAKHACSKVSEASALLPATLDVEVAARDCVWPRLFWESPPSEDCIGLYMFPASERDERSFEFLLDKMMDNDLALKAVVNYADLLIFSSCELPPKCWRFRRKYYLWGVFKKNRSRSSVSTDSAAQSHQLL